jgi:transcriptional regulator with XRE-family HTH domain
VEPAPPLTEATGLPGLRAAREGKGLSQRELAERTGVASSTISHLENAVRDAHLATTRRLAAALDVPVAQLLFGTDDSAPAPRAQPATPNTLATKQRRRS